MKFNWIVANQADQDVKKRCIDLEYELRPKITKYLLERFDNECCGDFSCFHFDIDVTNKTVSISHKTPRKYRVMAQRDFDIFINGSTIAKAS